MGFLDEISGFFSNTENLFQNSDQKSDQHSMSAFNSVTGGAVHFARSAVVEGLSFIPGVGSYALLGKTFWSLYRGQYSESITNVEALISYLPFGALEQLATGAYSLFTGKSATTKKDVSRFEAALQMAFGAFGLACDVRGFKASRLKLGEFLNRETARLLNPFHSFSRVRVPNFGFAHEFAGTGGLKERINFNDKNGLELNPLRFFSTQLNLDNVSFRKPELGRLIPSILKYPGKLLPDRKISKDTQEKVVSLASDLSTRLIAIWKSRIGNICNETGRKVRDIFEGQLLGLERLGFSHRILDHTIIDDLHHLPIGPRLCGNVVEMAESHLFYRLFSNAKWGGASSELYSCDSALFHDFLRSKSTGPLSFFSRLELGEHETSRGFDFVLYGRGIMKEGGLHDTLLARVGFNVVEGRIVIEKNHGGKLSRLRVIDDDSRSGNLLHVAQRQLGDSPTNVLFGLAIEELEGNYGAPLYLRDPCYMRQVIPALVNRVSISDYYRYTSFHAAIAHMTREEIRDMVVDMGGRFNQIAQLERQMLETIGRAKKNRADSEERARLLDYVPTVWARIGRIASENGFVLEDSNSSLLVRRRNIS